MTPTKIGSLFYYAMEMERRLTPTQKKRIGKLLAFWILKYHANNEGDPFLTLPPEVFLTLGDVSNIINNGQSIDVLDPYQKKDYNTVSTLTSNSYMFEKNNETKKKLGEWITGIFLCGL